MFKKLFLLTCFVLVLALAGNTLAMHFDGGAGADTPYWNLAANWDPDGVPTSGDTVMAIKVPGYGPTIANPGAAAENVYVGTLGVDGELMVTSSGSLASGGDLVIGNGADDTGTVVNEGSINVGSDMVVGFYGNGLLNMNGGEIDTHALSIAKGNGSVGHVALCNGTITTTWLDMEVGNSSATMNITGSGMLVLAGDRRGLVRMYDMSGQLTAYGGSGSLVVWYDPSADNTGVTATPCPKGDINRDCRVDIFDLAMIANNWLAENHSCKPFDIDNWTPSIAEGVTFGTSHISKSGCQTAKITVADTADLDWYNFHRTEQGAQHGELYEFSADIKPENTYQGVGAYLAIGPQDPNPPYERLFGVDSGWLSGTKDFLPVNCLLFIPDGINTIDLLLLMYAKGSAYFDNVNLQRIDKFEPFDGQTVTINVTDETIPNQFLGFGVQDDCLFYTNLNLQYGITEDDIALRNQRIAELNPPVISTLFWWDSICPTRDLNNITYDTELMQALYQTLEIHQQAGHEVVMSDVFWSWTLAQFAYNEDNVETAVPIYVELIRYLIQDKGFTCIRNVSICGEVDTVFFRIGGTVDSYFRACRLLREGLDSAGLSNVKTIGGKAKRSDWLRQIIETAEEYYNIFFVHEYYDVTQYPVVNYRLSTVSDIIKEYSAPIESSVYKPAFVWEIGFFAAGDSDPNNTAMKKFSYGLLCANTCIAVLNEGFVGGSLWCLHSMYYFEDYKMDFGLWEFKDKDWQIHPIYYGYGLFSKFAQSGMQPVNVQTTPCYYDFSAGALKDDQDNYILYMVNHSQQSVATEINGLPQKQYDIYEYAEDRLPGPADPNYGKLDVLLTPNQWSPNQGQLLIRPKTLVMIK